MSEMILRGGERFLPILGRVKNIVKELRGIDNAILFIDEIHILLDSRQGNSGAGNVLKPELSHGDLTVIGATTIDEYRKIGRASCRERV